MGDYEFNEDDDACEKCGRAWDWCHCRDRDNEFAFDEEAEDQDDQDDEGSRPGLPSGRIERREIGDMGGHG